MKLAIESIRTDGGTQPRAALDHAVVEDYADQMKDGVTFPPVTVFYDGTSYWLADGFHRMKAAWEAERDTIEADIFNGTLSDAQWHSYSANRANGLRRTNEDKQRAVVAALKHPASANLSNGQIAMHVGVSTETIRSYREKIDPIFQTLEDRKRTVTRNGTTYQQNTANIGRRVECGTAQPESAPEPLPVPARLIAPLTRPHPAPADDSAVKACAWEIERAAREIASCGEEPAALAPYLKDIQLLEMACDYLTAIIREGKRNAA